MTLHAYKYEKPSLWKISLYVELDSSISLN